ncbi:MAG: beta-lactamase family protein [Chitinophagales bacterium]|nr:beta-lactamase family protein [Chitinophagales bacterium]
MKISSFILLMTLFSFNSQAQYQQIIKKQVDAPAVYYAVLNKDTLLHEYTLGNLSLKESPAIDENSQFALFSITKIFTAIAVLQLQEKSQLHLDDQASIYLPQYSFLKGISIRQLLSHQSGLNNPIPIKWIHLKEEAENFDYKNFSRETLQTKAKIKFTPGKKSAYSNLNFLVLGEMIEKITGQDYKEYIQKNILVNNKNISFKWEEENAVTGYHNAGLSGWILGFLMDKKKYTEPKQENLIPIKKSYLNGSAYGGLMANARGLNLFLQELLTPGNLILSESSLKQMFTIQSLSNGKTSGHSLGWFTGTLNQAKYVHHAGGGGGFYLELRIYPELGIASYLLTNKSGFSDKRLLDKLDQEFIQQTN